MTKQTHAITAPTLTLTGLGQYIGKTVDVTVKLHREASSTPQRKYWFGVVISILAEHFGMTKDECHDAVMFKFTRYSDDNGLDRRKSYNDLSTADAERLHEDVRTWAQCEFGVLVPLPNEIPMEFELN